MHRNIKKPYKVWSLLIDFSCHGQFLLVTHDKEAYQGALRAVRIPDSNQQILELEFYWLCKQRNAPMSPWQKREWTKHIPYNSGGNQYASSFEWKISYKYVYIQRPRSVASLLKPARLGRVKGYTLQGEPFWFLREGDPSYIVKKDGKLVSTNEEHPADEGFNV